MADSHVIRFPACNFTKKETPAKTFFCEFSKIFKDIFWQDTSGWLLLVFICQFWEVAQMTSFLEYFWETYFKYKLQDSATSRCILVPFERYGRPRNIFPCMFHVKPNWNIVYKYLKNKFFFNRLKYPSPNALSIRYFWTLSYNYWGFVGITKLSNP